MKCSVEGCTSNAFARGGDGRPLCTAHYALRWPAAPREDIPVVVIERGAVVESLRVQGRVLVVVQDHSHVTLIDCPTPDTRFEMWHHSSFTDARPDAQRIANPLIVHPAEAPVNR